MTEALGGSLVLLSMLTFAVGLVALIRPLPRLKLGSRARAGGLVVASFLAFAVGGSLLPPEPTKTPGPKPQQPAVAAAPVKPTPAIAAPAARAEPPRPVAPTDLQRAAAQARATVAAYERSTTRQGPPAPLGECGFRQGDEQDLCYVQQAQLIRDWGRAWRGDIESQRNIAYCYQSTCNGSTQLNAVQGCAWRLAVLVAGHPEMGGTDPDHMRLDCGELDDAGQAAAKARAVGIADALEGKYLASE